MQLFICMLLVTVLFGNAQVLHWNDQPPPPIPIPIITTPIIRPVWGWYVNEPATTTCNLDHSLTFVQPLISPEQKKRECLEFYQKSHKYCTFVYYHCYSNHYNLYRTKPFCIKNIEFCDGPRHVPFYCSERFVDLFQDVVMTKPEPNKYREILV
jgi:hypothetical protein